MKKIILLIFILVLSIGLPFLLRTVNNGINAYENFSNYTLDDATGKVPKAETTGIVEDIYPSTGNKQISNNTASTIWKHYPIYEVGSYEQTTNNIRHPVNPDEGTCMPASMCGSLYHSKNTGSNIVKPLPEVNPNTKGTRINYYNT